ncbi:hypothetical protein LIER_13922 [Lithospermum erythrorhizon]|uniref:Uncharacterized protein n=1 Tax=Lithospermum erythrorhizon TaxID=34254 RepID=A0AAV3PYP9_LITER
MEEEKKPWTVKAWWLREPISPPHRDPQAPTLVWRSAPQEKAGLLWGIYPQLGPKGWRPPRPVPEEELGGREVRSRSQREVARGTLGPRKCTTGTSSRRILDWRPRLETSSQG